MGSESELPPTVENLRRRGERWFEKDLIGWDAAWQTLVGRELLERKDDLFLLTESGVAVARDLLSELRASGFNETMTRSDASPAYHELCRRVFGLDLCQFNVTDTEQLERLCAVLELGPQSRVLDLGCGAGRIAEHISDTTGAHVIGLDFAREAIAGAAERTAAKSDRLQFQVGSLDRLDLFVGRVSTIIAIDTLYFADDLAAAIGQMKRILTEDRRMGLLYSQIRSSPAMPPEILLPDSTKLARALTEHGLTFTAWEFTAIPLSRSAGRSRVIVPR